MLRGPGMVARAGRSSTAPGMARRCSTTRNTASFEYTGPPRPTEARQFGIAAARALP